MFSAWRRNMFHIYEAISYVRLSELRSVQQSENRVPLECWTRFHNFSTETKRDPRRAQPDNREVIFVFNVGLSLTISELK